jgi:hypothetical protein
VVERTIVHQVYTYEPAPYYDGYYYSPYYRCYRPVPPVLALPGAAACTALSLIGGC